MTVGFKIRCPNIPLRVLLGLGSRGVQSTGAGANAIINASTIASQNSIRVRVRTIYVAFSGIRGATSIVAILDNGEQLI
jgi:hypothetical protein